MISIKEVITKKDIKNFVDFPTSLYKNSKYYVPPMRLDEINLFDKDKNASFDDCTAKYFLAYSGKKIVGRIAAIIQHLYNEKTGEKRVRFTRFDTVNDINVARALFDAAEKFALESGMDTVHGPMGFNDLDREGMLVEGFDKLSTFETQYSYDYYPVLVEACGYKKEADWVEFLLTMPTEVNERVMRIAGAVLSRSGLKIATAKNKSEYLKKYAEGIFKVIDAAYSPLYGVVPFNEKVRQQVLTQFKLFINIRYVCTVLDSSDNVVAFGFLLPSVAEAVRKSKGRLTPLGIVRLLSAVKTPKLLDAALIGVLPEYQKKGLNAIILNQISAELIKTNIKYVESNPELETNHAVMSQWGDYEHIQHKRRRCYVKKLN